MTKAGDYANKIEALDAGWKVKRGRFDTLRVVEARRPFESWQISWRLTDSKWVFELCEYQRYGQPSERKRNTTAALREMAKPQYRLLDHQLYRLPFDPTRVEPEDIVPLVVGKTLRWRNGVSGQLQEATVRARIKVDDARRTLNFTDHDGFHSIRIDNIREIL